MAARSTGPMTHLEEYEMTTTRIPKLLTLREVEEMIGVPRWRLYQLLAEGKGPPHMKIGNTIRISEVALAEWIEQQHAATSRTGTAR